LLGFSAPEISASLNIQKSRIPRDQALRLDFAPFRGVAEHSSVMRMVLVSSYISK
jgi:hypothetical protein